MPKFDSVGDEIVCAECGRIGDVCFRNELNQHLCKECYDNAPIPFDSEWVGKPTVNLRYA